MKKISSIQLYRYNIGADETFCTEYIAMDYFDTFYVKEEKNVIRGCIGNQKETEDNYLALQEMCFMGEETFKEPDKEKMFLTLIQIFIHPNFLGTSYQNRNQKIEDILKKQIDEFQMEARKNNKRKIECQLFSLLTAGDYLISVISNDIHVAFEFSTTLRELYFQNGQEKYQLFTTYSIVGMKNVNEKYVIEKEMMLMEEDLVSIRGIYSDEYRRGETEKGVSVEHQLYGRYDYSIDITLKDFIIMHSVLMLCKQNRGMKRNELHFEDDKIENKLGENAKALMNDIFSNKLNYWNERILLKGVRKEENEFTEYRKKNVKCIYYQEKEKETLKQINENQYRQCTELLKTIEKRSSIREKERVQVYYELLERLLKISKNLNYQRELRLHVSILFRQMRYLVESMVKFREYYDDPMEFNDYERELLVGIRSLDVFAGYIRNINLQTLQAPNYNLQINGSIEKILMAYDWFITHVLHIAKNKTEGDEHLYYVSRNLCPVLIPHSEGESQSVKVLFEVSQRQQQEPLKNLMVISVPNVENMEKCESYIPMLCHELAHNIRFREQEKRNEQLALWVLKIFSCSLFNKLFFECRNLYSVIEEENMLKLIRQELKNSIFGMGTKQYVGDLKYFEPIFKEKLVSFGKRGNKELEEYFKIYDFIRNTQEDVLEFDENYLECLREIAKKREEIKECLKEGYQQMKEGKIPEKRLADEIEGRRLELCAQCEKYAYTIIVSHYKQLKAEDSLSGTNEKEIPEKIKKMIEEQKNTNPMDIRHYKAIHNCWWNYRDVKVTLNQWGASELLEEYFYYKEKETIAKKIFEEAVKMLSVDNDMKMEWRRENESRMKSEIVRNQLGIVQGDVDKFKRFLKDKLASYTEESIRDMSGMHFSIYREVASDLFMCGIFDFSVYGYFQFAVTHFRFTTKGQTIFVVQRCKMVCQTIWKRERRKINAIQDDGFEKEIFEKFAAKICKEHIELKKDVDLWKYLEEGKFSIQILEEILSILKNTLHITKENEEIKILYTKMYRFCKILRLVCEQKDYGMEEEKILFDFISDGSFFETSRAEEIRKQVFEDDSIREQIAKRWNEKFVVDEIEKTQKEQLVYANFLMNCYRKCQNDERNWENSK